MNQSQDSSGNTGPDITIAFHPAFRTVTTRSPMNTKLTATHGMPQAMRPKVT